MRIAAILYVAFIALAAGFAACLAFAQSRPPALREGFVDVPGARIFYKDSGGSGVPVVFLHAHTGSAEVWEHQIPAFTGAGYRFIAYDRRGYGRTIADPNGPAPSYRVSNPAGVARWSEFERKSRAPEAVQGPPQPSKNRVTLALIEGIKNPTLVIAGDADLYAPPALMRRIAERIKGAQFVAFPETGHSAWWETPDRFNRTVLTFIRRH